ncbi:MAG TPA: MurT ligase domain-containing protein [Candidatus Saccharimonadia bacterium]|nr:MurT ligase domain-containing protein [Candidatus Saccharimonadia bacterium]
MRKTAGTLLGKTVAKAVRLRGKSGGQALPGLVVETVIPGYLGAMLRQLPDGVAIITGTNGKTTTTKMVVELLRANGKRVLTNATGSNLTRGIISSVSQQATKSGRLPFDIAVFELDEAYASQFTRVFKPRFVLGLNASRDQLDRFGEVDMVAKLIGDTMVSATEAIITNADDRRLSTIAGGSTTSVVYFGVAPELLRYFPRDDELVAVDAPAAAPHATHVPLSVELVGFNGTEATYSIDKRQVTTNLQVTGQHNFQNAAGALALAKSILPSVDPVQLAKGLAKVRPAFGRGQAFTLKNGSTLQLNLVKNPASFRQGLASYVRPGAVVMVAINDKIADGRDMSWLWDVDFATLQDAPVAFVTGSRAADMALRLQYDDVIVGTIELDLERSLHTFCQMPDNKVIFATYTAMLKLHATLEKQAGKTL